MMVVGNQLWLGTGKGVVLTFTVSEAVSETEAAIAELVHSSSEQVVQAEEPGTAGQGLLTQDVDSDKAASSGETSANYHYLKRRGAFGRTLRGPSTKLVQKKSPAVFQLNYKSSSKIVDAESVKVLVSMW